MRWYIVKLADEGLPPWIVAEAVDEFWAKDQLLLWSEKYAVLADDALRLDPDLAPALQAWESRDDRAHAAYEAVNEAEGAADDAHIQAIEEGLAPWPPESEQGVLAYEDWVRQLSPAVRRYYSSTEELWQVLVETEKLDGTQAAAEVARVIARDLVIYSRKRGLRPV